jgi:hypothetical protein
MARKVYLEVKVRVILNLDDDTTVTKAMEEVDYSFNSNSKYFDVLDTEILDWEIIDSK